MHASGSCRVTVGSVVVGALSSFSVGWLAYYAAQDTIRRSTIRFRRNKFPLSARTVGPLPHAQIVRNATPSIEDAAATSSLNSQWHGQASKEELKSIKSRFAPLKVLGRYVNPFPEWRETGVWELIYWKLVHSLLQKPRRMAWEGGIAADLGTELGREKVETLLPVQNLDRTGLWGTDRGQPCAEADQMTYTWIGQSTCFIQMNGLNILTDPVFGLQPIESIFSPTRMRPMPCTIQELTEGKIDIVLISHK
jgi:N-acyl-phosphatidylethanolamine-hydrolysing phospholipase D